MRKKLCIWIILLIMPVLCSCGKAGNGTELELRDSQEQTDVNGQINPDDSSEATEGDGMLNRPVEGKELMCLADNREEAEGIAELYGIELVEYGYGVAAFHTERPPRDVISEGLSKGWPELSENHEIQIMEK